MRSLLFAGLSGAVLLASSHAENLLDNASFEFPKITGRTPAAKGGSPNLGDQKTSWTSFTGERGDKGGTLEVGMTDEIARTGKQSIYVDFGKLTALGKRGALTSDLVQVKPEQPYRISLWGRTDRTRPLTMDERRPVLLVEVSFFAADMETQVGDTEYRVQMIPGNVVPNLGTRLLFVSNKWSEYYTELKSPAEAAFATVTFNFEVPKEEGETDGIIYFDDAVFEGERGTVPLEQPETPENAESTDSKDKPAAPAATPATPTTPAKPASPAVKKR